MARNKTPYVWTEGRQQAWRRNSAIRDLRMLHSLSKRNVFTEVEARAIRGLADQGLSRLGAEPETARRERERAEINREWEVSQERPPYASGNLSHTWKA